MVVLDSHAVVWWASAARSLSPRAAAALRSASRLGIPTIVLWEISLLVRKKKLELGMPVREWAARVLEVPRVEALPLTADIALTADTLDMHPDPVDRFIVATALRCQAPLVTKDALLRRLRTVETVW
jgi:PIN domain nuclease of toxin-antitoxin system